MAGEHLERTGSRQTFQVAAVEFGAAGKIFDTVERLVFPCRDDALGAGLRQALHQAEAQRTAGFPSVPNSNVQPQSLDSASTGRTSTPWRRASCTSCEGV